MLGVRYISSYPIGPGGAAGRELDAEIPGIVASSRPADRQPWATEWSSSQLPPGVQEGQVIQPPSVEAAPAVLDNIPSSGLGTALPEDEEMHNEYAIDDGAQPTPQRFRARTYYVEGEATGQEHDVTDTVAEHVASDNFAHRHW